MIDVAYEIDEIVVDESLAAGVDRVALLDRIRAALIERTSGLNAGDIQSASHFRLTHFAENARDGVRAPATVESSIADAVGGALGGGGMSRVATGGGD